MKKINQYLKQLIIDSKDFDFPGLKLQAFYKGQKIVDISAGKTFQFYDLASLTKIIFTTTYFMDAVETKKVKLDEKLWKLLPWYKYKNITVKQLLNHSAGNEWWQPYYKNIHLSLSPEQKFMEIEKLCQKAPLGKSQKAVYSDLDFYLLGAIMQEIERKPLIYIWSEIKEKFYAKTKLHFNYLNQAKYDVKLYAPTEKCSWRKKILRGEVHDENAWALGGIAPHAGLFGQIEDLSSFGLLLRDNYFKTQKNFVSQATLRKFAKRSLPIHRGDWALGFMIPSQKNSSAGEYLSKKSFGHTGFTGISLWLDPVRDLVVSLVSNRVHPSRENKGFVRMRPKLHDLIVESIER